MRGFRLSLAVLGTWFAATVHGQIVINEVDADQAGTDSAEFVELYGPPSTSLDGYVLVFFNGSDGNNASYMAIDLDGQSLDLNGFFVVCGSGSAVANCDLMVSPGTNLIQNGADAVALYNASASDFPTGTPPTETNLVDALVYDTNDSDDTALIDLLTPGQQQINEAGGGNGEAHANARVPDGGAGRVTATYTQQAPTPGVSNGGEPGSDVMINEFVANHTGVDTHEYFEVYGPADTDYSHLSIVLIEGDSEDNPGLVEVVRAVGSTDASGFWFSGYINNELGGGTKTLLLVDTFTGAQNDDLDTNDDGTLDTTPWTEIVDAVAINDGGMADSTYSGPVLSAGFDGGSETPGGASRIPNGTDTNTSSDWRSNDFDGAGLPGFVGSLISGEALNTPGISNTTEPPPSVVLNEFVADHVGADTHEYLEVYGTAATDFSSWSLLQLDGRVAGNPGQVHFVMALGSTGNTGYWETGFLSDQLLEGAFSLLLVEGFTGMVGDDLDATNDGVLDSQPWTLLHDAVGVDNGDVGNQCYAGVVLSDGHGGLPGTPGGASRFPNGTDSDAVSDWLRNDYDGQGLDGFDGSLEEGEAVNTPGAANTNALPGTSDARINEFVADHTGSTDDHEFIEIYGTAEASYGHLWVVQINGNCDTNPGAILSVHQVGTTDAAGFWQTGFLTNQLDNGSKTLLLVEAYNGTVGTDLDTNDDGTLDVLPWSSIVDGVAVSDGGSCGFADIAYSETVLSPNYDGISFTPGGASRFPNGTDTDNPTDWLRNDFHGAGLPGFSGSVDANEALNTPGEENSDQPPPASGAKLSEFVADHLGNDTYEYVELVGEPATSYSNTTVLILNGDSEANPGTITTLFTGGTTDSDGFWVSAYQTDAIPNGSLTLLVVEGFSGSLNDDLDTNDDGTLDTQPWSSIIDDVAISDGGMGDQAYSSTLLTGAPGGASRYPYYLDTDQSSDWLINDFEGEGLPDVAGNLESGESLNTPGRVNRVGANDYYTGVDVSNSASLRASLHNLVDNGIYFPYTSGFTDSWDLLETADENPENSGEVITIYKNANYARQGGGNNFYNREHTWPKSYGFPSDNNFTYPYTDAHHLMLADSIYNSTRGNTIFGTCASCNELTTELNNGVGGGSGTYPGNSNWYSGSGNSGSFEVWPHRRGDVARALLYMDLRYEGGTHEVSGATEPDLVLTDDTGLITTHNANTSGTAYMGRLSTLLQWHGEDPVDESERTRNEVVASFQGNRNPFVDHPEWVACIFEDNCASIYEQCSSSFIPIWFSEDSRCLGSGRQSVLDLVMLVNETCDCF